MTVSPTFDPAPFVTTDVIIRRYPELCRDVDPLTLSEVVEEATSHIEDITDRRLAPFKGLLYQDILRGINPNEYGGGFNDMPLDFAGSLGASYANALGSSDLVRHFWLDQFAPKNPELWTYNINSITVNLTFGSTVTVGSKSLIDGPDASDGHAWLRMGTFAPEGSRIEVNYDGGYTVAIPSSLKRACIFQAAKFLILEAEPQSRKGMDVDELDKQIMMLLAPWARA